MDERYAETEGHPDYEALQPLPEELARSLTPQARHALNHPTRRRILRELHRDDATTRTPDELLPLLPGVSRATIAYHAAVLRECGGVSVTVAPAERGGATRSIVSTVAGDPEYLRVLVATEHLDAPV